MRSMDVFGITLRCDDEKTVVDVRAYNGSTVYNKDGIECALVDNESIPTDGFGVIKVFRNMPHELILYTFLSDRAQVDGTIDSMIQYIKIHYGERFSESLGKPFEYNEFDDI